MFPIGLVSFQKPSIPIFLPTCLLTQGCLFLPLADITVKAVDYSGAPFVATIKKDERYFPTVEWIQDASHAEGWKRITYEEGKAIQGEGIYGITF